MKAKFAGRCPICNLRIMKGDEITAGRWQRDIKEKYNYMQQRTEGGGTRTFKYAHTQCAEVMDVTERD
jgi:hypothetical protein